MASAGAGNRKGNKNGGKQQRHEAAAAPEEQLAAAAAVVAAAPSARAPLSRPAAWAPTQASRATAQPACETAAQRRPPLEGSRRERAKEDDAAAAAGQRRCRGRRRRRRRERRDSKPQASLEPQGQQQQQQQQQQEKQQQQLEWREPEGRGGAGAEPSEPRRRSSISGSPLLPPLLVPLELSCLSSSLSAFPALSLLLLLPSSKSPLRHQKASGVSFPIEWRRGRRRGRPRRFGQKTRKRRRRRG